METTEINPTPFAEPTLVLDSEAQGYLREAGKWATFLGILGFIFCGIILIVALFAGAILATVMQRLPQYPMNAGVASGGVWGAFVTGFYILIDAVYFFFSLYLYQFGDRIKKGVVFSDSGRVTAALRKLKSFFKLWGVTTIVVLALYALIFIIFIVIGIGAASMMGK
jgi:hypothetical protein